MVCFLEGGRVLRRVLRRGYEKGLQECTHKTETPPLCRVRPFRRGPNQDAVFLRRVRLRLGSETLRSKMRVLGTAKAIQTKQKGAFVNRRVLQGAAHRGRNFITSFLRFSRPKF